SRRMPLHPDVVDLNHLVADAVGLYERTLGETIEIRTRLTRDSSFVFADPSQIQNALLNLVINARDAMAKGGQLTIRTTRLPHDSAIVTAAGTEMPEGTNLCLSVSDTGAGIPPDVMRRVFEPFFTTKAVGKGTGLGLSMVYGFVKQSGGAL